MRKKEILQSIWLDILIQFQELICCMTIVCWFLLLLIARVIFFGKGFSLNPKPCPKNKGEIFHLEVFDTTGVLWKRRNPPTRNFPQKTLEKYEGNIWFHFLWKCPLKAKPKKFPFRTFCLKLSNLFSFSKFKKSNTSP